MSALVSSKMLWLFPVLTFIVSVYLAGALVLYLVVQSAVAIFQQAAALKDDSKDLQKISDKTKSRASKAVAAQVVKEPKAKKQAKRKRS